MSAFTPLIKKTLLAAGALGMAASALAAGPKDGIYIFTAPAATADAQEFLTFHTNDAGAVVAGIYRSKLASAPNGAMGLTTSASVGGNFGTGLAAGAPAPSPRHSPCFFRACRLGIIADSNCTMIEAEI